MPRSTTERREAELRVLLPPSLKLKASERARREGRSLSTLMMNALEAYLAMAPEHPLASLAGRWSDEDESMLETIRAGRLDSSRPAPEW